LERSCLHERVKPGCHRTQKLSTSELRVGAGPLQLDGTELELQSVSVDGLLLDESLYTVSAEHLTIDSLPEHCELTIVVHINPLANTALEGLYCSNENFCHLLP